MLQLSKKMMDRKSVRFAGREYGYKGEGDCGTLPKDPVAATGYLRRGQSISGRNCRLILFLDGGGKESE